jgi:prevent-host-death family protein
MLAIKLDQVSVPDHTNLMDTPAPGPISYDIAEAKARLSELLDAALRGDEVVISRNNEPVVRLTLVSKHRPRPYGIASDWKVDNEALLAPMDEEDLLAAEGAHTDEFGLSLKR